MPPERLDCLLASHISLLDDKQYVGLPWRPRSLHSSRHVHARDLLSRLLLDDPV